MLEALLAYHPESALERMFFPFGDMRLWRWLVFGAVFLLWAAYPLLYRTAYRRAEQNAIESAGVTAGSHRAVEVHLGWTWLLLGLAGFAVLAALVGLPYALDVFQLQWKLFDPFLANGVNRTVTFLGVVPAIVGFAAIQYWWTKKPVPQPVRLVLAGSRAIALWLVFILICGPFTSVTRMAERPFRAIALVDDSLSMGEAARQFAVASDVQLAPSLRQQLSQSVEGAAQLRALDEAIRTDKAAVEEMQRALGPIAPKGQPVELADVQLSDFEMREFVRKLVIQRAKRIQDKVRLLQGGPIEVSKWRSAEAAITQDQILLAQKELEIAAESQQEKPNAAKLSLARSEAEQLSRKVAGDKRAFEEIVESGKLFGSIGTASGKSGASGAASTVDAQRDEMLRQRIRTAIRGLMQNLLSTIDDRGPTRWDIATELLAPGNELTIQNLAGLRLVDLALAPQTGQLPLVDLLRRNAARQPDLLPADFRSAFDRLGISLPDTQKTDGSDATLRDPLVVYTFSSQDDRAGGLLRQVPLEELDFQRPVGTTTQVYAAYNQAVELARAGDVATILLLSDGHDTSVAGNSEQKTANDNRKRLTGLQGAPRVIAVAVGHPRPEKVLHLQSIIGDDQIMLDEIAQFELRVRANAGWEPEVILYEDLPAGTPPSVDLTLYEIPYDAIDGKTGIRTVKVRPGANGAFGITSFRLQFKPKKAGNHRYTVKLNRRRMPGEDTFDNNVREHQLNVDDRKIRVLFIDEPFRYETRYLMEALCRDKALEVHTWIADADTSWPQKASEYSAKVKLDMPPLVAPFSKIVNPGVKDAAHTARANDKQEWFDTKYDVVILGDVNPSGSTINYQQVKWLNEFVTKKRGGIIWLAGKHYNPFSYTDPDLAELIPVKLNRAPGADTLDTTKEKYYGLTLAGQNHEIFAFSHDRVRNGELWGTVNPRSEYRKGQLDGFMWYSKIRGPKNELCTVLARVAEQGQKFVETGDNTADALIVSQEVGNGRSLFVGTDELWRMRRFFADFYTYRFWQNAIRWAATSRLKARKDGLELRTDDSRYRLGQPVYVSCDLLGDEQQYQGIAAKQGPELARALQESNDPTLKGKQLLLVGWRNTGTGAGGSGAQGKMLLYRRSGNHFDGVLYPNSVGTYELNIVNEPVTTKAPTLFMVEASSEQRAEISETELNFDLLRGLASLAPPGEDQPNSGPDASVAGTPAAPPKSAPANAAITTDTPEDTDTPSVAGTPRAYHFFQAASLNPDLRTRTVETGTNEREAFSLVELMIVIACLFAAEWLIRKLVRLA